MTKISPTALSTAHPVTFARGRTGDVYGVNGEDRGFRWDGVSAEVELIGITAPATAPTLTAETKSAAFYVSSIDVTDGGFGYETIPAVTVSGTAKAKAELLGGSVHRIVMQDYGSGYTAAPPISIAAPDGAGTGGSGAVLAVIASGSVRDVRPASLGSGYTSPPAITASGGSPSQAALFDATINAAGQIASIQITNPGAGYTSAPTLSFSGGGGSGASASVTMSFTVTDVTVTAGGVLYSGRPKVQFSLNGGAYAEAVVNAAGQISDVTVRSGGSYGVAPSAAIASSANSRPRPARALAVTRPGLRGKYWSTIRYIDNTSAARGGPIASSISALVDTTITSAAGSLTWTWSNAGMEDRVDKIELWRTTSDQALVLYRVAVLDRTATSYTDTTGDSQLIDPDRTIDGIKVFGILPVVLPNGQVNARRFNPPPRNKRVIAMFQDRAWYGVDVPGKTFGGEADADYAEPNSLYFSEVDEPESVPETNEIVIQENVKGQDRLTALMPFGGGMVLFQTRHAYRLSYAAQPIIDASVQLITQRGCLNQRCWDVQEGVAYVVDSMGMYTLDGTSVAPISEPISTFWTDSGIDFSQSKFFFVRIDPVTRIVRFFHSAAAGFPDRALCYRAATQAWWVEIYAQTFAAAECLETGGRQRMIAGGQSGSLVLFDSGHQDLTAAGGNAGIACSLRSGAFPLAVDKDRHLRLIYKPTTADCNVSLALHYNNSESPRPSAIATDRGIGFTTNAAGPAVLNMKLTRSALGEATGYAICHYSGRIDDRSAGGDRHIALAISAVRPSAEPLILYGIAMSGAG